MPDARVLPPPRKRYCSLHGRFPRRFRAAARCIGPSAGAETLLQPARALPPPCSRCCTLHLAFRCRGNAIAACTSASPAVFASLHAAQAFPPPFLVHGSGHTGEPPRKTTLLTFFDDFDTNALIRFQTVRVLCSAGADQPPNRIPRAAFPTPCRGPFRTSLFRRRLTLRGPGQSAPFPQPTHHGLQPTP